MVCGVVVKATVHATQRTLPRRVSFPDASSLDRDTLTQKLARSFSLQHESFRIAYRDDDNDLIELATTADVRECLDFFATDPSLSSVSSAAAAATPSCITVKLEIIVEYDGPNLSETDAASSVWSAAPRHAPASRASSFGGDGERDAVLTRWRMQQQQQQREEATVDAGDDAAADAASDAWIRRPAFAATRAHDGSQTPPVDSTPPSSSASAVEADIEDDWDRRTVSSVSFADQPANGRAAGVPLPRSGSRDLGALARRPPPVTDDALYPNFAPPPRWLASLGAAAEPPYPLPFSYSPYSAPKLPGAAVPQHGHPSLPSFAPHTSHHPLFPPLRQGPTVGSVASSFSHLDLDHDHDRGLASPSQSLRERVQDLFAPSSDEEGSGSGSAFASVYVAQRGGTGTGTGPLLGRRTDARSLSVGQGHSPAPVPGAKSTYAVTDSDADSLARGAPGREDPYATVRAGADETAARLRALVEREAAGEYWCAECGARIEGARYSCAVCAGFDLCRNCELGPPSRSSSSRRSKPETIPLLHDSSHIVLKIPILLTPSTASTLLSARDLAASLSQSRPARAPDPAAPLPLFSPSPFSPTASSTTSTTSTSSSYLAAGELDSYWSWWMRWYAQMPPDSHALWPTGLDGPSKHSWGVAGSTSVGGGGGGGGASIAKEQDEVGEHTYPPKPPQPQPPKEPQAGPSPAPPAAASYAPPPASSSRPSDADTSASAVVRPTSFSRFSSPHFAAASHNARCAHCGKTIAADRGGGGGVRWLCGNCPTVPSFDLCPTCEPLSTRIHDRSHTFLRITHPLRRPLPSIRQGLLPILCLPATAAGADDDAEVVHRTVMCDACGLRIKGAWMRCCHCPTSYDLCRPCLVSGASEAAGHNPSHVFAALKQNVDLQLLKDVTRITTRRPRGLIEWDLYA